MTELLTTITAMAIHPANSSPVFGEMTTHIAMTSDEAAGIFFELTQDDKTIGVTVEELRALLACAETMLAQPGAQEDEA